MFSMLNAFSYVLIFLPRKHVFFFLNFPSNDYNTILLTLVSSLYLNKNIHVFCNKLFPGFYSPPWYLLFRANLLKINLKWYHGSLHADLIGVVGTASGCFSLPPWQTFLSSCSPVLDFSNQASNLSLFFTILGWENYKNNFPRIANYQKGWDIPIGSELF